jgi:DNA-binding XRE family transcriptional regulator
MKFGEKLKYIRQEVLNLTQQELADSIHFTQGSIAAIENAKNKEGSFELFRQLVMIHHVNPMYFIYEKSNEPPILKREGSGNKPLLQKIAKYEKLVDQLIEVKKGK